MKNAREQGYHINNGNISELQQYERGWSNEMVTIWREKLGFLRVIDTGRLYSSVAGMVHPGPNTTIEHKFMLYGLYVAAGVGHEFRHDNMGDLPFLGAGYRQEHNLDKPKAVGPAWSGASLHFPHDEKGRVIAGGKPLKPRDWYVRKYIYSIKRLNEAEMQFYGYAYQGLLSSGLDAIFNNSGAITRSL